MTTKDKGITLGIKPTYANIADYSTYANGSNWAPAWQAAHDYLESLTYGGTLICPPNFNQLFNSAIIWNPNKVAVNMNGATFDFSGLTGVSYAITLRQTVTDANQRGALNRMHPWANGMLIGTGSVSTPITGIQIKDVNPIAGTYWAPGISIQNVAFKNWTRDIEISDGGFFLQVYNCIFFTTGATGLDICIYLPNATNAGENINFIACFFGKVLGSIFKQINVNANVICRACSADYTPNIADIQGGTFDWDGYIENNYDTNYWIKLSGSSPQASARIAGTIVVTGNKTTYEPFYCDPAITTGSLDIDVNFNIAGGVTFTKNYVAGTGKTFLRLRGNGYAVAHPALGLARNALANYSFESSSLTEYTLTGATTLPARSTTYARTGTNSLKLTGQATTTKIETNIPCQPWQTFCGELYYRLDSFAGSGATFYVTITYIDGGGNSLYGAAILALVATNVGAWTVLNISSQLPAPIGTRSVTLSVQIFGVTSGTPLAYIDDIQMQVA